jgi:uncharacterized integral membrane protein
MPLRTLLVLVTLALVALFAAVNWAAFITPTELSLIVATVTAPLGVILLALLALEAAVFFVYVTAMQAQRLVDARRFGQSVQQQMQLAEKAEASRLTELRGLLETEMASLRTRLDAMEGELRRSIDESNNVLAAHIGEVEDKLDRQLPPGLPR